MRAFYRYICANKNANNMLTKNKVEQIVKDMPEQFSIDELLDRLILIQKIEEGIKDIDDGNTYTTEQAKKKLEKWLP